MLFSARVILRVVHAGTYVPVIQQQYVSHKYEYQLVLFLACPYYSIKKYCEVYIYHTWYFIFYMVNT